MNSKNAGETPTKADIIDISKKEKLLELGDRSKNQNQSIKNSMIVLMQFYIAIGMYLYPEWWRKYLFEKGYST
jgi:hypothetical protein